MSVRSLCNAHPSKPSLLCRSGQRWRTSAITSMLCRTRRDLHDESTLRDEPTSEIKQDVRAMDGLIPRRATTSDVRGRRKGYIVRVKKDYLSMPQAFSLLREIERCFGRVKEFSFPKDRDIIQHYHPLFFISFESDSVGELLGQSAVVEAFDPNVDQLQPGGVGLDQVRNLFMHAKYGFPPKGNIMPGPTEHIESELSDDIPGQHVEKVYRPKKIKASIEPAARYWSTAVHAQRHRLRSTTLEHLRQSFVDWNGFADRENLTPAQAEQLKHNIEIVRKTLQKAKGAISKPERQIDVELEKVEEEEVPYDDRLEDDSVRGGGESVGGRRMQSVGPSSSVQDRGNSATPSSLSQVSITKESTQALPKEMAVTNETGSNSSGGKETRTGITGQLWESIAQEMALKEARPRVNSVSGKKDDWSSNVELDEPVTEETVIKEKEARIAISEAGQSSSNIKRKQKQLRKAATSPFTLPPSEQPLGDHSSSPTDSVIWDDVIPQKPTTSVKAKTTGSTEESSEARPEAVLTEQEKEQRDKESLKNKLFDWVNVRWW